MSNWEKFVDIILNSNYFIVFIAILMVIIMLVILYLVKLQIDSAYGEEKEETLKKEDTKAPKIIQIVDEKKEDKPIYIQSKFNFSENLENDKFLGTEDLLIKTQEMKNIVEDVKNAEKESNINRYEKEQEEQAIISYEELSQRKNDIEKGLYSLESSVIDEYEEEQEKKAIISYDELLEKAGNTILTYEDTKIEGLNISKVDTVEKNNGIVNKDYKYEEEFLRALKEFRRALWNIKYLV